jgi:hypothetical protein
MQQPETIGYARSFLMQHDFSMTALELLNSLFHKNSAAQNLASFKNWEREKISNFGLNAVSTRSSHFLAKDIQFNSWKQEKASQFGLSESGRHRQVLHQQMESFQSSLVNLLKSLDLQPLSALENTVFEELPEKTAELKPNLHSAQKSVPLAETVQNQVRKFKEFVKPLQTGSVNPTQNTAAKPVQNTAVKPQQKPVKNTPPVDDFFKILGYE